MTNNTNCYDKLYENMKRRFTVTESNTAYTLGDYMLMKANVKKADAALPVALRSTATKSERAVATIVSYVNDKLTIKAPPVKDKTIHTFPFRASASAFLSASVACAFIFSFCLIGAKVMGLSSSDAAEASAYELEEEIIENNTEIANVVFE